MMKPEIRRWLVRGLAVAGIVLVALLVWKLVYSGGEDGRFARGNGRIEATEVDVAAKSGGRVAEILVNEGDFVQAGQLVARMDQASLAAQLTQAQAQLANARSSRETMLAQVAGQIVHDSIIGGWSETADVGCVGDRVLGVERKQGGTDPAQGRPVDRG